MLDYKGLEEALSLVSDLCNFDQIQGLLRARKGLEDVKITAETKRELVDRNLRKALEARSIPLEEVFELIRRSEENGDQHIFYFRSHNKKLNDLMDREFFARQLLGAGWEQSTSAFPELRLKPNDFCYSDLHRPAPNKPKDWLLKIYGHATIVRATGKEDRHEENVFWREFKEDPLRIVLVARWNSPDILEIRVQRDESRRRVEAWVSQVWNMLRPALIRDQFEEWDLSMVMRSLILAQRKNSRIYEFRDASLVDGESDVHATFSTYSEMGNLFADERTKRYIEDYAQADSECNGLTVTWLAGTNGIPKKSLRTMLAPKKRNEMVVAGRCIPEDLDYVTEQLRSTRKSS